MKRQQVLAGDHDPDLERSQAVRGLACRRLRVDVAAQREDDGLPVGVESARGGGVGGIRQSAKGAVRNRQRVEQVITARLAERDVEPEEAAFRAQGSDALALLGVKPVENVAHSTRSMRGGVVSGHHTVYVIRAAESRRLRDDRSRARAAQWDPPTEEVPMSIKTDNRLDEMRERIGELEAKAQAAGDRAKQWITGQVEALRQHEAAARAAAREAHEARTENVAAHAEAAEAKLRQVDDAADAKVEQLQTRVKAAEHALAAELAEDRQAFSDAMHAYQEDFKELSAELNEKAKTLSGNAREQADAAISDMRRSRDAVAERVAQARTASDERWRESKASVAAARAELERKADAAMKKIR